MVSTQDHNLLHYCVVSRLYMVSPQTLFFFPCHFFLPPSLLPSLLPRVLPVVIVMVTFGTITGQTRVLGKVDKCSCWCKPIIGNVLPWAYGRDEVGTKYL